VEGITAEILADVGATFVLDQFDGYDVAVVTPGDALLVARSTSLRKR
jgi:hypothetical protein